MQQPNHHQETQSPFQLDFITPYSTYRADGMPTPTPFLLDGLLTEGGFSVLGAKPKVGKSSWSRALAVSVAKGADFLGRNCTQGEVLLCSLEDPLSHVDNCLGALGYQLGVDRQIHIVKEMPIDHLESVGLLRKALTEFPGIRLVVIDHLATFLNVPDLSDYIPVKRGVGMLLKLARDFPHVHIMILAHAKKVRTEDPFDGLLGSTALRGAPDTNIVILNERGNRVIVSETRVGRAIPATILTTDVVTRAGSDVVQGYSLGGSFDQWDEERKDKSDESKASVYATRIIEHLKTCEDQSALQTDVLNAVTGKTTKLVDAIRRLEEDGVVGTNGTPKRVFIAMEPNLLRLYQLASTGKETQ
jgi:hypothetical protein